MFYITCFTFELSYKFIYCLYCVLSLLTLNLTFNLKTTNIVVVFAPPPGTNSMTSLLMFQFVELVDQLFLAAAQGIFTSSSLVSPHVFPIVFNPPILSLLVTAADVGIG